MSGRKKSFSAILTPAVTQKSDIFAKIYAKTSLACYLLLLKRKNIVRHERER